MRVIASVTSAARRRRSGPSTPASARAHVKRARLPFTCDSFESVEIVVPSAAGRSSVTEDPWLCVPASRRVCPGRVDRRRSVVLVAERGRYVPADMAEVPYHAADREQSRHGTGDGRCVRGRSAGRADRRAEPRAGRAHRRRRSRRTRRAPRSTSPTLKMLANGSQRGSAKMSVSGSRFGLGDDGAVRVDRRGGLAEGRQRARRRRHEAAVGEDRGHVAGGARARPAACRAGRGCGARRRRPASVDADVEGRPEVADTRPRPRPRRGRPGRGSRRRSSGPQRNWMLGEARRPAAQQQADDEADRRRA